MKRKQGVKTLKYQRSRKLHLLLDAKSNRKKKKKGDDASHGLFPKIILGVTFIVIFVCVSVFLAHSVVAFFIEDDDFKVRTLYVSNNSIYSNDEIAVFSGILSGENIFSVDLTDAQKKLEDHSNIKKVELTKQFPDSVHIKVYEREPVAILSVGKKYLIDEDAVLLSWDRRWKTELLPYLIGVSRKTRFKDKRLHSYNLTEGLRLIELYNNSPMKTEVSISKVDIQNSNEIIFYTDEDFVFKLDAGCGKKAFEKLYSVYTDLKEKRKRPSIIDVRFKDVVVLPKEASKR
ncbi:MAG: FtsQ-type POTRA domain-containing protein [Candidatus Ancaeobacter aquaticus]|nr:FtsQ-type POTRA domain-containing protein [Candidatus Ancaeobacter aquaticus]